MPTLTHFDESGAPRMVDVSAKPDTARFAKAAGRVSMSPQALALVQAGRSKKGDAAAVAELAGVMGAKRTADLIPLCHPLALTGVDVRASIDETSSAVEIVAIVKTTGQTGVEMEALAAVTIACLALYDMMKSVDRGMTIDNIRLLEKTGGASGDYARGDA